MQKQVIKNGMTKTEIFHLQLFSQNFNENIQENKILLISSPEVFEWFSILPQLGFLPLVSS